MAGLFAVVMLLLLSPWVPSGQGRGGVGGAADSGWWESRPQPILPDECDPPLKPHQLPGRGGQAQRPQTMALSAATSEGISKGLDGIILIYTGFCFFPGT